MSDENRKLLDAANRLVDACAGMSMDDRLLVLQLAWMILAQQARNDALAFPGGFPAEQTRQLAQLEKISHLVGEDTPDLELERLTREGDFDGALEHLRKIMGDLPEGGE
jgi:hypothetical protein